MSSNTILSSLVFLQHDAQRANICSKLFVVDIAYSATITDSVFVDTVGSILDHILLVYEQYEVYIHHEDELFALMSITINIHSSQLASFSNQLQQS